MRKLSFFLLICLFLLGSQPLHARVIHVPGDQPTIQEGINSAVDGDTVMAAPGWYYESINFRGRNIVVMSVNGPEVTAIAGQGIGGQIVTVSSGEDSSAVLQGFTITGGTGSGGIYCLLSSLTIRNNIVRNNTASLYGGGIYLHSSNSIVEGNIIEENMGAVGGGGVNADNYNGRFVGNIVRNNTCPWGGGGMRIMGTSSALIANNLITKNTGGGSGINCRETSTPQIIHNTIDSNEGNATVDTQDSASPVIWNNIISNNTGYGIVNSSGMELSIAFNNLWNNSLGNYYECSSDSGEISADPIFIDPSMGDYHLTYGSPCIDSARDVGVLDDFDGDARPFGTTCDMGFDEATYESRYDLFITPTGPLSVQRGDTLRFRTLVRNYVDVIAEGEYWLVVSLPNSNEITIPELLLNYPNPIHGQIFPFDYIELENELLIPTRADTGSYQLIGRIGTYPSGIFDEESFGFRVVE